MLCLFEDSTVANFLPVAATRHVGHLLAGTMTLRARALVASNERQVTLHGRRRIRDYYAASGERVERPAGALFVNARFPLTRAVMATFPSDPEWIVEHGGEVMAARLGAASTETLDWEADALDFSMLSHVPRHELHEGSPYVYLWDLLFDNGRWIVDDFGRDRLTRQGEVMNGAHLVEASAVAIGAGSVVKPGAVIDASAGPVIIGEEVEIMPNAVIEGPCYIGDHCRVKIGAKIYGHTSIGPWCKVGGEVENSIILGYSNKQHDGFLGHSYLGHWVNLGADTNTSDLKNNYGHVRVTIEGREIDSGRMFLGALIGDHAKTSINTMLNTGTVIGVGANIFGSGFPPKEIPPFAWGGSTGQRYRIDDAVAVAGLVMQRRAITMTPADEELLRRIHAAGEPAQPSGSLPA
ncbi:MAG: transferase [Bacteroidetes bacterium]|nr:transferase [Bacteroidota bacterium]